MFVMKVYTQVIYSNNPGEPHENPLFAKTMYTQVIHLSDPSDPHKYGSLG